MNRLDQSIDELVKQASPHKAPAAPARVFGKWLIFSLLATLLVMHFQGMRQDLAQQMQSPIYLAEITCLFLIVASTALAAVWLSYPDMRQKKYPLALPSIPLIAFGGLSVLRILHPELGFIPPPEQVHGMDCALCVTGLAIVPGLSMFYLLRQQATTHPMLAGGIALLAAGSIGMLALKFVEANDSVAHLLIWHLSPALILGVCGAALGRKFLAW